MKNLIYIFILLFSFIGTYAQGMKTPRFHIVEKDTLGVLISISDAQKLDNDGDILKIYEQLALDYDTTGYKYLTIIDNMGKQIATLKLEITKNGTIIATQADLITDLKRIIAIYETDRDLSNLQAANNVNIIKNLEKKVKRSFWQKIGGSSVALVVIGFLILK